MARILIADDEPAMRAVMAAVLHARGHTTVEAGTAREALRLQAENPADLVVTDLVMKEMDGTELLRRLRAASPSLPVVAVSGDRHGTIYLNMAKLLGADRVLAKPFEAAEFGRLVELVLANARSGSRLESPRVDDSVGAARS